MAGAAVCRVCGSESLEPVLRLERAPRTVSRLLRPDEVAADAPVPLEAVRCEVCGHVQLAKEPEGGFYDDYLMTVSHSAQMRDFQRAQAARLVERFDLAGKRVIEVGAGDGHYLALLRELDVEAEGIEPSARFREAAAERGIALLAGYVTASAPIEGAPYDAFVTREVLEHVPDPNDFLGGIRRSLADDGVGLVEVPSLEQALEHGRFYDFFPDHLNYFSAGTLARVLERNGFLVDAVTRGMNGEYLEAWVRADGGRDFAALGETVAELTDDLRSFLAAARERGERVAVWGAGAKGLAALAEAGADGIAYVVDSDPYKQGLHTPATGLPIVPPARLREDAVDAVVLTALAYRDEIVRELREEVGFRGTIAVLGRRLELLGEDQPAASRIRTASS
jgi:SAM-dependent methyltransferase